MPTIIRNEMGYSVLEGKCRFAMPTQCPQTEREHLTAEFWPEGLNAQPISARVISLAPGVLCLSTETPPAPGARFVTKFSVAASFPSWRAARRAGVWNEDRVRAG